MRCEIRQRESGVGIRGSNTCTRVVGNTGIQLLWGAELKVLMYERICPICKTEFTTKYARRYKCTPCKQAYDREYHKNRSSKSKADKQIKQRARIVSVQQFVWDYLKEHPCGHCGETDPVVLEFNHIDPSTKTHDVSNMAVLGYSLKRIKDEIAKCEVLCANCHRRVTAKMFGWYKKITR